jgi:hypothetical protein
LIESDAVLSDNVSSVAFFTAVKRATACSQLRYRAMKERSANVPFTTSKNLKAQDCSQRPDIHFPVEILDFPHFTC